MTQTVTVRLNGEVVRKAKILAARRGTTLSRLTAAQIEALFETDEAYERAKRQGIALLDRGFHLGARTVPRAELHER